MARTSTDYTPLQFVAGQTDLNAKVVTIPANQTAIPALTPLKRDANYKCVPATALTDKIVGLLVPGKDSDETALVGTSLSASDQTAYVYTSGDFWGDMVNFASIATADNNLKKDSLFDGTQITIKFHDYTMPTP